MWGSRRRLEDDVKRWRTEGWVSADGERHILAEIAGRGSGLNLASVLGILASVLLAAALISFVAAHWEEMGRWPRLLMLFALIAGGYGAAGVFEARGQGMFADAAILFGVAAFGASIALVSQMFHIDGRPADGVLLGLMGAMLAGILLRSNPALALSMVVLAIWSGMRMSELRGVHWPFLIGWAAISAAFAWQRWAPGVHLSGLALSWFVVSLGFLLYGGHAYGTVAGIGLLATAFAVIGRRTLPGLDVVTDAALGYGIAVTFIGLFVLQFFERISSGDLIMLAALTLAGLLLAIWYGLSFEHRGALWLGYIGFSVEVLALYRKTAGSLLNSSLFFLVAGLIVAGLAAMAWRLAVRRAQTGATA